MHSAVVTEQAVHADQSPQPHPPGAHVRLRVWTPRPHGPHICMSVATCPSAHTEAPVSQAESAASPDFAASLALESVDGLSASNAGASARALASPTAGASG